MFHKPPLRFYLSLPTTIPPIFPAGFSAKNHLPLHSGGTHTPQFCNQSQSGGNQKRGCVYVLFLEKDSLSCYTDLMFIKEGVSMTDTANRKHTVLYLEDDFASLPVDWRTLQNDLSANLIPTDSAEEAMQILQRETIDLFVLDIELANGDNGRLVAERIRRIPAYATTPIVFVSMHSHLSHWLFSSVRNCTFLPKPFSYDALLTELGAALGIKKFLERQFPTAPLQLGGRGNAAFEIDPLSVCYIETVRRTLQIQYTDGHTDLLPNDGLFQELLTHIAAGHAPCLRQIYRSIVINIHCVRTVETNKNVACVYLFHSVNALPLGMKYRGNLHELL